MDMLSVSLTLLTKISTQFLETNKSQTLHEISSKRQIQDIAENILPSEAQGWKARLAARPCTAWQVGLEAAAGKWALAHSSSGTVYGLLACS